MARNRIYTTFDIGNMTGTDPTTVHKWIDRGLMKGFRTPGGHRRVTGQHLRAFLVAHGMPIPEELREPTELRLLLVEDDFALVKSLVRGIQKLRPTWSVEASSDGYQALVMVPTFMPNVVVLDILMPGMDGLQVLKAVKAYSKTIHVLALTGKADMEKRALADGASGVMRKPATAATVVEAVERACGILGRHEPVHL